MNMLEVLRHDLHKIRAPGAPSHREALHDKVALRADGFAAWISRNFLRDKFENQLYRKSLIFPARNLKNTRTLANARRVETVKLFKESDPVELHTAVLNSKLLNLYSEAREFPYTSLKYHILLVAALYYNFKSGYDLKDLYLCENVPVESPFQVIYHNNGRKWAILPLCSQNSLSKIYSKFHTTWERRRTQSIGGDSQIFAELLTTIGSWSVALATIEDYFTFVD